MKLPDIKKWKLPRRVDLERLLIVGASALVVVLALHGGGESTQTMVWEESPVTAETSTSLTEAVEMVSTVCWYEDGDGYLVPVTRQIPLQDGIAKATLSLMVQSSENDLAAARMGKGLSLTGLAGLNPPLGDPALQCVQIESVTVDYQD